MAIARKTLSANPVMHAKPVPEGPEGFRLGDYPIIHLGNVYRRHYTNLTQALRPVGLSTREWRVLALLSERDGRSIGEVSDSTGTERAAISRLIDHMEAEGWVSRDATARDRRMTLLHLTEAGRHKYSEAVPLVARQYNRALRGLSQQELNMLTALLKRVGQNTAMPE